MPPPSPPRQTNLALQFSSSELPNGLRVVLVRDPKAVEISVTMRYQVGAADDPPEQQGMAHLVEHLMFQQVLGAQSLFAKLEGITSFFNATTTWDATTYVARAQPVHLEELLAVEAVRIGFRCTSITDATFERERAVVLEELKLRDAGAELVTAMHGGVYPADHPYAHRPGGTEASVGAITRAQACAFADAHYATNNAVLVVSGNITAGDLAAALGKFLARTARRTGVAPAVVAAPPARGRRVEVEAPVDDPRVLAAWPLPADPALRTEVTALWPAMVSLVDSDVAGHVTTTELGDGRAPMLAVIVTPAKDETTADVIHEIERAAEELPHMFKSRSYPEIAKASFDRIKQLGVYDEFSRLETEARDERLAAYVLAGRDPSRAVNDELAGLREMTADRAAEVAHAQFTSDTATYVVLKPRDAVKHGARVEAAMPIHDLGQRRDPPDPALARVPATTVVPPDTAAIERTLPNGLRVVLRPETSVPTIDVRLVFGAGTADEPTNKRGAAVVAANALTWDWRYINDYLLFAAAGGSNLIGLDADHTTFAARGVDMHLDLLLAGLRRWVRNGRYRDDDDTVPRALLRQTKRDASDDEVLSDSWLAALYGGGHPYVGAGRVRYASIGLDLDDARAFRDAHFTPDNATLVIAGKFDAPLADKWIDFLFGDWTGHAETRTQPPAHLETASLAKDDTTADTSVQIALPATAGTRAQRLVAAAMLGAIARDVRHQLGASYVIDASLAEQRLSSLYLVAGAVDAARTQEAVELIRTRLDELRTDPDAAARAFVTARAQVLAHALGDTGSAEALADSVEADVAAGRAPGSDRATAREVGTLTIDGMGPVLAELDLARAAMMLRGPRDAIDAAYAALGRTPTRLHAVATDDELPLARAVERRHRDDDDDAIDISEIADALTLGPSARLGVTVVPAAYGTGKAETHSGFDGPLVAAEVGYRFDRTTMAGLQLMLGHLSGGYDSTLFVVPDLHDLDLYTVGVSALLSATGLDRVWGGVTAGIHINGVRIDDMARSWEVAAAIGVEGGVDVVKLGRHRIAVYARLETELLSDVAYAGVAGGLAYRFY